MTDIEAPLNTGTVNQLDVSPWFSISKGRQSEMRNVPESVWTATVDQASGREGWRYVKEPIDMLAVVEMEERPGKILAGKNDRTALQVSYKNADGTVQTLDVSTIPSDATKVGADASAKKVSAIRNFIGGLFKGS
jgi:hypothetical protein